jgi:hypothetical protein
MEICREIGTFLWEVINSWAGYTTGGLIVALLWLWSTLKQKPTPRLLAIGVAILFLLSAFFNAWRSQYDARNAVEKDKQAALEKFKALTIPNLSGDIDFVALAPEQDGCLVTLTIEITNKGAPSIARGFSIQIVTPSGKSFNGEPLPPPTQPIKLYSGAATSSADHLTLDNADFLPRKAVSQPIATGGAVSGFVQTLFMGITREEALVPGTVINVRFKDINEKSYVIQRVENGNRYTFPHLK